MEVNDSFVKKIFIFFVYQKTGSLNFTRNQLLWGYAFLLTGLAYFFGLFIDLTGDSGLYAAISRQMVESGDWFNLQINGKPYDQKPHLFFWLAGLGIKLFGNSNFAYKLFPFLYGISGIYFTYRLGKAVYSKEAGILAALIVGTSQVSFLYFFDFHTDSILQAGVVLALWQLAEYLKTKRAVNFVFGFAGVGLAMLSKGPIGAVLPFFAVLFYLLATKDFRQLFHPKWLAGILIVLAIISPTLIHLYNSFGAEGIKFYFITNNFGRITGEYAGSSNDPFFYLYNLLWIFLPWTFMVFVALFWEIKAWFRGDEKSPWSFYLLGSVFVLLVVLSIAKGKAPNYILIGVAPVSVVVAGWLGRFSQLSPRQQKFLGRGQLVIVVLLLLFVVFLIVVMVETGIVVPVLLLLAATAVFAVSFKKLKSGIRTLFAVSVIVAGTMNLILNTAVIPGLFEYQAARRVLEVYNENRKPGDKLYNYHSEDYELFFYSEEKVHQVNNSEDYAGMVANKGTWLHTIENGYKELVGMGFDLDSVYVIPYRGMNQLSIGFLNPGTREEHLDTTYLIHID